MASLMCFLALLLGTILPLQSVLADEGTPVTSEEPVATEPSVEPTQIPAEAPSPTTEPTSVPTVQPTDVAPTPTTTPTQVPAPHDELTVTGGARQLEPGASTTLTLTYTVSGDRTATNLTASLVDALGHPATSWLIQFGPESDWGSATSTTSITDREVTATGTITLAVAVRAPGSANAATEAFLRLDSQVELPDGSHVPGLASTDALDSFTITAIATPYPAPGVESGVSIMAGGIENDGRNVLGYSLTCGNPVPANLTVGPGGIITFTCSMSGLASLGLLGLQALGLKITVTSTPATWQVGIGDSPTPTTGVVVVDIDTLAEAALLTNGSFTVTTWVPCGASSGSVGVRSTLTLVGLGLVAFNSRAPITVTGTGGAPSLIASNAGFGTSTWTGTSYPTLTSSLTLTAGSAPQGCTASAWSVQISGTDLVRTGGTESIPIGAMAFTSGTSTTGFSSTGVPFTISGTPATIATGTGSVALNAQISLGFTLEPPGTAPPGAYQGTLTFTTATGP